jgi:GNAT superfamily N-acetyltransferase
VADEGAVGTFVVAADVPALNRIVNLGLDQPASEVQLGRMVAAARERGVRRLFVQLAPGHQPAALADWIASLGGRLHNRWVRLWRQTAAPPEEGTALRVAPVLASAAPAFGAAVAASLGLPAAVAPWLASIVGRPGWRAFGAFDGPTLVATGALFASGPFGWLGLATTHPAFRGRGAQRALIARRLAEAAALGCAWVAVETAEDAPGHPAPSYHNLLRLGFTEAYRRPNYLLALA